MGYNGKGVEWCDQLNRAFDDAMMVAIGGSLYPVVCWYEGKHELYCMGGEL